MKYSILFISLGILCLSCDESYYQEYVPEDTTIAVRTMAVEACDISITRSYFGRLTYATHTTHHAETSGRVRQMSLVPGQRVKSGQRLASFPPMNHQLQINQVQIMVDELKRNYLRQHALNQQGAVANVTVEDLKTQLDIQNEVLDQLEQVNEVTAAFDGIITQVFVRNGEEVVPGMPIFSMADDAQLHVEFFIPVGQLANIRLGDSVTLKSVPAGSLSGIVIQKAQQMDKNRNAFRALAEFDNPGLAGVGQMAELEVELSSFPHAVVIPEVSVKRRGQAHYVYLLKNGRAEQQVIKIRHRKGNEIIIGEGIATGDHLIVAGIEKLTDGIGVRSINEAK
ncbi:MAG: efflux RND transporter periplasmic adaptor subunit [Bacteroidota bacterium]